MVRRDATGTVPERAPCAGKGRRPCDVGGTALLGASGEGDDAIEAHVGLDIQIRRGIRELEEDGEFAEVV